LLLDQLARLLERRQMGKPFEERVVPTADLGALDLHLFKDYCRRRFGPEDVIEGPGLECGFLARLREPDHRSGADGVTG